jgi:hypothetical protein
MALDASGMSPLQSFDATKKVTNTTQVTWITVDDVPKKCKEMDKKYGTQIERGTPLACSFFNDTQCIIVTSNHPNIENLGHEMRHCFQGRWHD